MVGEPDEARRVAFCPLLQSQGGATWGETQDEALTNIQEVVQMTVQSMIEHDETLP